VLTGETGAGKTALLGACKLLIGERGDAQLVRAGSEEARVEARFLSAAAAPETARCSATETPEAARFSATETPAEKTEHIVVRRLSHDGRSRCALDDSMVTVGALAEHIGPLVDLYGQHDHQSLLRPATQRAALDSFGGSELTDALETYRQAFAAYQGARQNLERVSGLSHDVALKREQAAYVLREIAAVAPQLGEYEALEEQLPRLRHAGELAEATRQALTALREEGGVLDMLSRAEQTLNALGGIDARLASFAATCGELAVRGDDLAGEMRNYVDGLDFDPRALDEALERLTAFDGLIRRFGPRLEEVFAARAAAEATLSETDDLEGHIARAQAECAQATDVLDKVAARLGELRREAAALFSTRLTEAARDLAMPDAVFSVEVTELARDAWTSEGAESVEICYRPAARQPARPLAKIASGGELSRVMLAIKSLGHEEDRGMTLVFDEIDAGIGGAVARAVATRLRCLAARHQVLVVTHLAQIAAVADDHWVVEKREADGEVVSGISRVCGQARVDEIARMLAGSTDRLAREHARELLSEASAGGAGTRADAAGARMKTTQASAGGAGTLTNAAETSAGDAAMRGKTKDRTR
jgi:DNA repair protein RecN (Recombination protein N)